MQTGRVSRHFKQCPAAEYSRMFRIRQAALVESNESTNFTTVMVVFTPLCNDSIVFKL